MYLSIYDRYTEIDEYGNHKHYFSMEKGDVASCQKFFEEGTRTRLAFTTESCGIADHLSLSAGDIEKIKSGSVNQFGELCWEETTVNVSFTDVSWLAATLLHVTHDQMGLSFVDAFRFTAVLDEAILVVVDIILLIGFTVIVRRYLSKKDSHLNQ